MRCSMRKPPQSPVTAAKFSNSSATVYLQFFPRAPAAKATIAARGALDAAMQAVEAARGLMHDPSLVDEPPLEIVVALHVGTAIYGNIGAADRLGFTVFCPAVNLGS